MGICVSASPPVTDLVFRLFHGGGEREYAQGIQADVNDVRFGVSYCNQRDKASVQTAPEPDMGSRVADVPMSLTSLVFQSSLRGQTRDSPEMA